MAEFLLSEAEPPNEEDTEVLVSPLFEIIGDLYVCSECGYPLTEIPAYNRFYCENCGLHY